ncbi:MAG: hypothetical protein LBG99_08985 [Propionibacteriaceae bacterium]|jgi:hypothetical protein|nr:hypothetical protein [Propionibacteriaceae bacterium]
MKTDHEKEVFDLVRLIFRGIRTAVMREEFFAVVDFLHGIDSCCGYLDLNEGFNNWLVPKLGLKSCYREWPWLVLDLFHVSDEEDKRVIPGQERELIAGLGALLCEYIDEKKAGDIDRHSRNQVFSMVETIFETPSVFVMREEFFAVVDYINGIDSCCEYLELNRGFHDWLLPKLGLRSCSYAWPWLVLKLLPGYEADHMARVFPSRERELIDGLGKLMCEYLNEKQSNAFR